MKWAYLFMVRKFINRNTYAQSETLKTNFFSVLILRCHIILKCVKIGSVQDPYIRLQLIINFLPFQLSKVLEINDIFMDFQVNCFTVYKKIMATSSFPYSISQDSISFNFKIRFSILMHSTNTFQLIFEGFQRYRNANLYLSAKEAWH